jgi:hypothetical protein
VLTHDYRYDTCLTTSVKSAWTVDDSFHGRDFDFSKPFLPERIAGVGAIGCLSDDEKRMLNQIRGNSYCHIFAFVEDYIVPLVFDRARRRRLWRRDPAVVVDAFRRRGGQTPRDAAAGLRTVRRRIRRPDRDLREPEKRVLICEEV